MRATSLLSFSLSGSPLSYSREAPMTSSYEGRGNSTTRSNVRPVVGSSAAPARSRLNILRRGSGVFKHLFARAVPGGTRRRALRRANRPRRAINLAINNQRAVCPRPAATTVRPDPELFPANDDRNRSSTLISTYNWICHSTKKKNGAKQKVAVFGNT